MIIFGEIHKNIKGLGFLFLIASLLTGVFSVQALSGQLQETRTETFTLEDFEILTDQNFQGVQVDRTFNLALPGDWTFPSEATLSIRFSHSTALSPISSMNVRWNDNFVGSTRCQSQLHVQPQLSLRRVERKCRKRITRNYTSSR